MDKQETLALWAQGKDAWNAWAKDMLDRRAEMEKAGTWSARWGRDKPGNEATAGWMAAAAADFSQHVFDAEADFEHVQFPASARFVTSTFEKEARFNSATFSGDARFVSATFSGDARFVSATFSGDARFTGATFSGYAGFTSATFSGYAWFDGATFSGYAGFAQVAFTGYTTFAGAGFEQQADFSAAKGERAFDLEGTRYAEVPDFIQAHFAEAPRLDNSHVHPGLVEPQGFWGRLFGRVKPDVNRSARYRALKRLAIDGHDHAREQEYFAGELKALRGHPDRWCPNPRNWLRRDDDGRRLPAWPGGARYWFGVFYQILSDFGRSMLRPLRWWALALAGFAFGYLDRHFDRAAELGRGYAGGAGGWLWASMAQPLVDRFPQLAHLLPLPAAAASPACLVGAGEPWKVALGLSIRKALPFAGVGSTEKLNQIYACLYGIHGETAPAGDLPARFTPVIPDGVDYLGIVQLLLSLLLLFLFLLAVRSHFRIR